MIQANVQLRWGREEARVDWSGTVTREFGRRRLTPQLAVKLAQQAFRDGRVDDGERLVNLAYELFDFAAANVNRE